MRVDLMDCGVNTRWLSVAQGSSTGVAIILLVQGENAIVVSPGAFSLQVPGKKKPPEKLSSGGSADVEIVGTPYLIQKELSMVSQLFR